MNNIVIIGGDKRQKELKKILSDKGYTCRYIGSGYDIKGKSVVRSGDTVILPVPVSKDGESIYSSERNLLLSIKETVDNADCSNLIFGGNIPKVLKAYFDEKNIPYLDYLGCEELTLYNAYLTGLGAVRLLYENTESDIKGKKTLVTGFGRVARFTAQALLKEDCDVYVSARNSLQLTEAECYGFKTIKLREISSFLYLFDYVFNTVPENIFSFEDICHIKGKYFELASSPFGVKKEYFTDREESYVSGGSLPGRYLPYSAAEKLAQITVEHINMRNGGD
ncbi:MAG: hypothetical protein IJO73_02865 [Clostridia bacterium]|nr:hypothetical protein [Clostridia bacterium]